MNKRQMCPVLLFCPNMCLVWMGQTLNMLLLVKCCSFFTKCDKKSYRIAFFSSCCVLFNIFLRMTLQKLCQNYTGTKSTFKVAQKLTSNQFCSKNVLNEKTFPKKVVLKHMLLLCHFYHVFCARLRFHFDCI